MPVSSRGYFAFAKESSLTLGTEAPRDGNAGTNNTPLPYPKYWAYPVEEVEFTPEKQFIDFQEIRGSRQAYTTLDGAFQPTAMIKGAVYPGAALAQFLYGAFGETQVLGTTSGQVETGATYLYNFDRDPDTAGDQGAFADDDDPHIATETAFFDGSTLPSFTLERSDGKDGSSTIVEQLRGCKVESIQFTANFGEKVDMTVNFQATKKPTTLLANQARSAFTSSVTNPLNHNGANRIFYPGQGEIWATDHFEQYDITPLYFNRAAIKIDNVDTGSAVTMKTLSWEMTNTLERQETLRASVVGEGFNITQVEDAYTMFEGGVECTLSGTAVFESLDLYQKMMEGTNIYLELWLGSNTPADLGSGPSTLGDAYHGLYFYWPRLKVSRASIPFTAGEVIESDIEFKVIYAPSAKFGSFKQRAYASDQLYGNATAGITGGSMFSKMVSRMPGKDVSGTSRPIFY
jgi:hypothetical protein